MKEIPEKITNEEELEELLSRPSNEVIEMFSRIEGDLMFLGINGKIGLSLASMAKRACEKAGVSKKIYGVSRFGSSEQRKNIESIGIKTIRGDLLDSGFLKSLPKVKNVFFLAGTKFGAENNLPGIWAINSYMPALVAEHFKNSRIVAFSTGCVYPLVHFNSGGSKESDRPGPIGEYAQSCLGREIMFEYCSKKNSTPVALIRLNYSVELRYGVLVDIAIKVKNEEPIDLSMGYFNAIWQGDSNDVVLRSLELAESPAKILNITGEKTLQVQDIALEFAKLFNVQAKFIGDKTKTALLSNSALAHSLFGRPKIPVSKIIQWIADWINQDKKLLGKPTHYEVRDGKY